ncbi:MAG: phage major capsid protein [Geminicoccaceae bacterium]
MTLDVGALEVRLETEDHDDDRDTADLAAATRAIEELRVAWEQHRDRAATVEQLTALNQRLDAIERRSQRPGTGGTERDEAAERRAFEHYLRHFGTEQFRPDEVRVLSVANDGAVVPETFLREILKDITEFSPMRSLARVTNVTGSPVILPRRLTKPTAGVVAEGAAPTGSESTYGQWSIAIFELREFTDISNQLLEDSAFGMDSEIREDLGEAFGEKEGELFFTGAGTTEPLGLIADPAFVTVLAAVTAIDADELIDLFYTVKTTYGRRGTWGMNRSVIAEVRKFKNTAGDYLWRDSLAEGQPPTFLGRPVVEVPALAGVAINQIPVVFGDFNRGFRILDRIAMQLLPDRFSRATNGEVRFHARRRVGGKLVRPEALVGLKMPAV